MPDDKENQIEGDIKPDFVPIRIFISELILFSATMIFGIASGIQLNKLVSVSLVALPDPSIKEFVVSFAFVTLVILFFTLFRKKFQKGVAVLFKILFIFSVFFGGFIALSLWISTIVSFVFIIALIVLWLVRPSVFVHDILIILGIAGTAGYLGLSFNPWTVVLLLILFSFYDFMAVFKTKHMVKMARAMIETGSALALIVPQGVPDFNASTKGIKTGGRFLVLGGGDIVFPLILCVSLIPNGIFDAFFVAIFSAVGLFVSFWIFSSQKIRNPIPALPPIAFFSIVGFLITLAL